MSYSFRLAEASDAIACAQIILDWGEETPWMTTMDDSEPMAAFWRDMFTTSSAWVALKNQSVVGFCVRKDDNISALYVASTARHAGVGKKLLDLAKKDREWITVWAYERNTEARKFYRREGCVEISRETEHYEDGVSLVDVEHRWTRST
ncbi:MAG: GNAT family N-acetyltransferase, partial [Hyphomicrobiales bacterium]